MPALSLDIRDRAIDDMEYGIPLTTISSRYGVTVPTLRQWQQEDASAPPDQVKLTTPAPQTIEAKATKPAKEPMYAPDVQKKAVEAYKSGLTVKQVGKKLGIRASTNIYAWLKEAKVPLRTAAVPPAKNKAAPKPAAAKAPAASAAPKDGQKAPARSKTERRAEGRRLQADIALLRLENKALRQLYLAYAAGD